MTDIDDIAVERRCRGDLTVALNREEKAEAFRRLQARDLSAREIADVLGVSKRQVTRWRSGRVVLPYTTDRRTS